MNKYDFMENVRRMRMPVLSLCPIFCTFRMNCPPTSQHREHCEKNGVSYCSCPYYLCHFLKANSQIPFVSSCLCPYCPWPIIPQNFVFFPSISISENSLCNFFHSVNSEIFPFVEQRCLIFILIS